MNSHEIVELTGLSTAYEYRELERLPDKAVQDYLTRTRELFAPIAKSFDGDRNAEWLMREYLALKYVIAATVLGTSAEHAERQNLQITLPYLSYYMMLNCCRAFIFSLPCTIWKDEISIQMTHSNIINSTTSGLRRLNDAISEASGSRLETAKFQRDLFSYRFPASGLSVFGDERISLDQAIETARLLTDLTQANFACLQSSMLKHGKQPYPISDHAGLWHLMQYQGKASELIDDSDYSRVGYFLRKHRHPVELVAFATEGLVEDFFGAWSSERDDGSIYDPDSKWDLLLWVP